MDTFEIRIDGVTFAVERLEGGGYFASTEELPGCLTEAETLDELVAALPEVLRLYIDGSLAEGLPVPAHLQTLASAPA